MMNFGSLYGSMMGQGAPSTAGLSGMLGNALGVAPKPMPSQIGTAISGIFGNTPKPAPMQLPNFGGGAQPVGGARPIAGLNPVANPMAGMTAKRQAWFTAHPSERRFAKKGY